MGEDAARGRVYLPAEDFQRFVTAAHTSYTNAGKPAYTVKMTRGKKTYDGKLQLVPDPRSSATPEDLALQHKTAQIASDASLAICAAVGLARVGRQSATFVALNAGSPVLLSSFTSHLKSVMC